MSDPSTFVNMWSIVNKLIDMYPKIGASIFTIIIIVKYIMNKNKKNNIKEYNFNKYTIEQKHTYIMKFNINESELNKFYESFNKMINNHRISNNDAILDFTRVQTITDNVFDELVKGIYELMLDNRVRLKIIFPHREIMNVKLLKQFNSLLDITKNKTTILVLEDSYDNLVTITNDRRKN